MPVDLKAPGTRKKLINIVDSFSRSRVLVVGDLMIDHFIQGTVSRISPEAPVPVVTMTAETLRLGGAANVVHNVRALGGTVFAAGAIGNDAMGKKILQEFRTLGVNTDGTVKSTAFPTTVKTRIIAHHQQVVRFDRETLRPLPATVRHKLLTYLKHRVPQIDAVIISDYGKTVICQELMKEILTITRAHDVQVIVDPKVKNIALYHGVNMITPNQKEAGESVGLSITTDDDAAHAAQLLQRKLDCDAVLITRGEYGMTLLERNNSCVHIPTLATEVYDVTGAGDTVISALTLALATGASPMVSALIANIAAGIVVRKLGTAVVESEELKRTIQTFPNPMAD
nr:D-glycero-beta-D-manno-heptose-7-phosphate kinase [Deltaproteobacteria bacterium]